MRTYNVLTIAVLCCIANLSLVAQTIWSGPTITFSKAAMADWTLEENQDRIRDSVWITRANNQAIFNIAQETGYTGQSPVGTEWAMGTTTNIDTLTFTTWVNAVNGNPTGNLNKDMVLHLIADDIYIDIKFTSWASGSNGGGAFSYERSTQTTTSNRELETTSVISVFPCPATDFIQVSGLPDNCLVQILDISGARMFSGSLNKDSLIDVSAFKRGLYFIHDGNGWAANFIVQ